MAHESSLSAGGERNLIPMGLKLIGVMAQLLVLRDTQGSVLLIIIAIIVLIL
jgi:hypothetical protein